MLQYVQTQAQLRSLEEQVHTETVQTTTATSGGSSGVVSSRKVPIGDNNAAGSSSQEAGPAPVLLQLAVTEVIPEEAVAPSRQDVPVERSAVADDDELSRVKAVGSCSLLNVDDIVSERVNHRF